MIFAAYPNTHLDDVDSDLFVLKYEKVYKYFFLYSCSSYFFSWTSFLLTSSSFSSILIFFFFRKCTIQDKNMTTCNKFARHGHQHSEMLKFVSVARLFAFVVFLLVPRKISRKIFVYIYLRIWTRKRRNRKHDASVYVYRIFAMFFSCFYLNNKLILTQKYHYIFPLD